MKETVKVTRFEVINHTSTGEGRAYIKYGNLEIEFSIQDEGRTLKVFITENEDDENKTA